MSGEWELLSQQRNPFFGISSYPIIAIAKYTTLRILGEVEICFVIHETNGHFVTFGQNL
jgi:hypothetical protein